MSQNKKVSSVGAPRFSPTLKQREPDSAALPDGERTLRLLDYRYDEARDIVLWKVEDLTRGVSEHMRVITLAYPSGDLAAQFGHQVEKLDADFIEAFSQRIKNRPWPFKITYMKTAKRANKEWIKSAETDSLLEAHDELSNYPFREVQEIIADEDKAAKNDPYFRL
jgi:hypothetical protein